MLRIEPDELDAQRFERLVLLGRETIAGGDPHRAVPLLAQALDLWRGEALSDVGGLAAARNEIARLDDLRTAAIEDLAESRLALGEYALAIDLTRSALTSYPLNERLTASLMLALYRSGRHAEALHAYSDLERRLDTELGIEPTPELRRLEEDVLLHRPHLDARPAKASRTMSQVRAPIGRFIGRRAEISELLETLHVENGAARLVVVRGEAGIGKSALIEEFCRRAERTGAQPLLGSCSAESTTSYQPVVEILRELIDRVDSGDRANLPSELALVLSDLMHPTLDDDIEAAETRGSNSSKPSRRQSPL